MQMWQRCSDWVGCALLAAALVPLPGATQPGADSGVDATRTLEVLAARERRMGPRRLSLSVTERRGAYKGSETEAEMRAQVGALEPTLSEGSLLLSPSGWRRELVTPATSGTSATRNEASLVGREARALVDAVVEWRRELRGRLTPASPPMPGDAVLTGTASAGLAGIRWSTVRSNGLGLTLQGARGPERHTLVLTTQPDVRIESWRVRRDQGEGEYTYDCVVKWRDGEDEPASVEEWVSSPPPASTVAFRITAVRSREPLRELREEALPVRFPARTLTVDARRGEPVDYEWLEAEPSVRPTPGPAPVGRAAPPFELRSVEGQPLRLADLRGKTVVLLWFLPGSAPTENASKPIRDLSRKYGSRGVQFIGLFPPGRVEGTVPVELFRQKSEWKFPVAPDPGGSLQRRCGLPPVAPSVAIVSSEGILFTARAGLEEEAIASMLDRLTAR